MQIDVLRYFIAVCESGSIVRAARQGNISQQGLSKTIQGLESELGVTLLVRERGEGSVPTEAGRELYECAKEIIRNWDETRTRIGRLYASERSNAQTIGSPLKIFATTYVMNNLDDLFRESPIHGNLSVDKGTITLFETDYIDVGRSLLESVDNAVAIVNTCAPLLGTMPESPYLEFDAFLESDILITCVKGFFPSSKKILTHDDLTGIPFALHSDRVLSAIMGDYLGNQLNLIAKTSDFSKIEDLAVRGEAVTITDTLKESQRRRGTRRAKDSRFVTLPIAEPPKTLIGFVRPKEDERSAICRQFEERCKQRAQSLFRNFANSDQGIRLLF